MVDGDVAAHMLIVNALNERAEAFYRQFGFRSIPSAPRVLFLSMATAKKGIAAG